MKKLILATMLCLGLAAVAPAWAGTLTYERWTGYTYGAELGNVGTDFPDGLAAPNMQWLEANAPTVSQVSVFQMDEPSLDYYAGRIWGWIVPPADGEYTFWLASDDDSRLWISSDEDPAKKALVCYIDGWCGWDQWDDLPDGVVAVRPATRTLVAGKPYYVELLWSDGTGGGHGRVNWEGPIGARQDITSEYLRSIPWGAIDPIPADGATEVGLGVQALSWDAAQPHGATIASYEVYFGEDPNVLTMPLLGTTAETTIDTPELVNNKTYYWRVKALVSDSNYVDGVVWSFASEDWGPEITQQPQDTFIAPACTTELTIAAQNKYPEKFDGEITYTWYRVAEGDDELVGTGTSLVTGDIGEYYCVVANDEGSVASNTVTVTVGLHLVVSQDVGTPQAGNAYYDEDADQLVVTGNGDDIWNAADSFHYVYKQISGDFDLRARVRSMSGGTNEWRKFGVMARQNLTAGSIHSFMCGTATQGMSIQGRRSADSTDNLNVNGNVAPFNNNTWSDTTPYGSSQFWVRLTRVGNVMTGYVSNNGTDWVQYGSVEERPFVDPIYVGFAVTSHNTGELTTARFSDITLNGEDMMGLPWDVANVSTNADPTTGWVSYDDDVVISWEYGDYTPCDADFNVYFTMDMDAPGDPIVVPDGEPMSVTLADAEYGFEHDQTWYYRIEVVSAAGKGSQAGQWMSVDTVKWVPVIYQEPAAQTVVDVPTDVTLVCQVETVADDFADPTSYVWKRVVGDKDGAEDGDDDIIFTGTPTFLSVDGKRKWDCSVTLTISGIGDEGNYYCVVENESGTDVSNNALILIKRLVLHYGFESIVGNTVVDASPSGYDGTLTSVAAGGSPVTGGVVDGMIGKAIKLIGADDPNTAYVDVGVKPFDMGIQGNNARSVSAWVKVRNPNGGGIFDMGAYATGQNCSVRTLTLEATGNIDSTRWRIQHWGGADRDFTYAPSFDAWVHFVYTFDGTTCKLYANGEKLIDSAMTLNTSNANNVRVGVWQSTVFNGLIDELRMYNYALSPLEVGQLYIEGVGGSICIEDPAFDLTGDCKVDLEDFAIFAASWAESTLVSP